MESALTSIAHAASSATECRNSRNFVEIRLASANDQTRLTFSKGNRSQLGDWLAFRPSIVNCDKSLQPKNVPVP
jgi:hypothetical protein